MINTNIEVIVDKKSIKNILSVLSKEQQKNITVKDIQWRIGDVITKDNNTYMTLIAVGIKPKIQFSDAEFRVLLEQSSSINSFDLYAGQFHTDVEQSPILEIQSTQFPNGTPLLHKE